MANLTKKQEAIFQFIRNEADAGRPCPTHREVADRFKFASLLPNLKWLPALVVGTG